MLSAQLLSCVRLLVTPMDCMEPPVSSVHRNSLGKNTGVGCHAILQGIFPTQGSIPGIPHCRWIFFYHLSYQGSVCKLGVNKPWWKERWKIFVKILSYACTFSFSQADNRSCVSSLRKSLWLPLKKWCQAGSCGTPGHGSLFVPLFMARLQPPWSSLSSKGQNSC